MTLVKILEKILQKAKDLYGWDKSLVFYYSDRRAYYKALAEGEKKKMNEAKDLKQFNRAKFMYERYISEFDRADFVVRNSDHDATEDDWRGRK